MVHKFVVHKLVYHAFIHSWLSSARYHFEYST